MKNKQHVIALLFMASTFGHSWSESRSRMRMRYSDDYVIISSSNYELVTVGDVSNEVILNDWDTV